MCLTKTGLKAFLLVMNVLLFLCGAVIMGIGIWAVMDKLFLSYVIGNTLFSSAAILTVLSGTLLLVVSFVGCGGAISMKKMVVIAYAILVTIIFILLMTAGIVASVLQDNIESKMKEGMTKTITENYGYLTDYNDENRKITDAWDLLQSRVRQRWYVNQMNQAVLWFYCRFVVYAVSSSLFDDLECCAVNDRGWVVYQYSRWFVNEFRQTNQDFVPESCCKYVGKLQQYQNLEQCQTFDQGPPRYDGLDLAENPYLHHSGCFEAAKTMVLDQSTLILSIGFSFCVFLLTSIVISIMFLGKIAKRGGSANLRR